MLPPCRVTIGKRSKELLLGESTGTDASDPIAQTSGQSRFCHSLVALRNVSDSGLRNGHFRVRQLNYLVLLKN